MIQNFEREGENHRAEWSTLSNVPFWENLNQELGTGGAGAQSSTAITIGYQPDTITPVQRNNWHWRRAPNSLNQF